MKRIIQKNPVKKLILCMALLPLLAGGGCGRNRLYVVTGTSVGLHCTPGDGSTTPPQVSLAYKRTELAIIPTAGKEATKTTDAYSSLAGFDFKSHFFGETSLHQFISTGFASRGLLENPAFYTNFGK